MKNKQTKSLDLEFPETHKSSSGEREYEVIIEMGGLLVVWDLSSQHYLFAVDNRVEGSTENAREALRWFRKEAIKHN